MGRHLALILRMRSSNTSFIPVVRSTHQPLIGHPKPALLPAFSRQEVSQRIIILGNVASGKSTPARTLRKRLSLPVVHQEALFWNPGWLGPDAEQFRTRAPKAIAPDAWICEDC